MVSNQINRRTLALATDFANRHGVPKAYATIEEVLESPDVDAVYIATRPGTHLEIALKVSTRSEERRVGKECRSRWAADQ